MFRLTSNTVEQGARRAAAWLAGRGLQTGDRVAVVASNRPEYVALTLGALRTGIVPVLVNVHLGTDERDRILADADPALVVSDDVWPDLDRAPGAELAPHPLARPMHYTSGTTGLAKGVWSGILSESDAAALAADEQDLWDARPGETYLLCSPLYHSAPHRIVISALAAGADVVIFERFDAAQIARAFVGERIAGAFLVPTHLRRLLVDPFEAPHTRRILHAGEPCPEQLKRRAIDAFGAENLWEFYGSTEGQFALCSSIEWLERPGTVGRARSGRRLSIADPGADGVGTIYVEVPSFARWEYWNDPTKTAAAWNGDSFTVGDLGRLDGDGYLFLEGRREDLIISGGVNVYPAEVERVLQSHPAVVESAVFGIADAEWGQMVCAAVVGDADPDAVLAYARELLPGSHSPKRVVVVDALPRTSTGKVLRSELEHL
ncbi:MAG TPA: AMP-binding protein [Actinomycetota bacterium]|jgi:acyl-CoA synthetase (AMP-forming)/AMP-acid ligase II|nr:AMP-binding protein [Actinomycetota bacterium]